jgi:predicted enzyme related to lactoylglutathione lyase
MTPAIANPVVHLELHTANLPRAVGFYTRLFGWKAETIRVGCSSYLALGLSGRLDGGVVEHDSDQPLWLPYVEVDEIDEATERAEQLGAVVRLDPREGPAGWRSVLETPAAGQIALWQPKA